MAWRWKGKPIEELTREELIVALTELGQLYIEQLQDSQRRLDMFRLLRNDPT